MTETHGAAQSGQLSIGHTTIDGIRVVTLRGEIDHTVKDMLAEAMLSSGDVTPPRVVADFSGVTFMDSSGINVFLTARQAASGTEGWVRIADAQEAVLRVLQIIGLDQLIPCYPTVEQALTASPCEQGE
ncbi:STAS domain-containing protein [Streptomyces sp. Qhu-G9]|uniref:STAS domain-containing protein n=1 Tax=Streptomyces sp. Qhu-G9 TaxID=3452799 RepID=UPI0022AC21DC|nr:STAS domain-containing protein [Streptomyces aurantiacus]WAU81450.1 STAS domain-containing protein [Streptomyces aurantiacus]